MSGRGAVLELRSNALIHNVALARQLAGNAELFAMVKANAYGHGLGLVARTLLPHVDGYGVAVLEEALTLRQGGIDKPILLLQGIMNGIELQEAVRYSLEVVVHSPWQVAMLCSHVPKTPLKIWLKVDTGMHRLGLPVSDVSEILSRLHVHDNLLVVGLMSHFACADLTTDTLSEDQLELLRSLAERLNLPFSIANSAGLMRHPACQGNRVRPGIMLYGSSPLEGKSAADLNLLATQSLRAKIIAINHVPAGESVGYGSTWAAQRDSQIAVISLGYGDGYPRHAPNGTPVAIHGVRSPIAGRVSMDLITVDVTGREDVRVGDEVELWGDYVPVDEVAALCDTISYELFCQVTDRVGRRVDGEA